MAQNEKLTQNKNEITQLKNQVLNREKEHETLFKKLADLTMNNKMLLQKQEPFKKKIEALEQMNKSLMVQNEDLKKSKLIAKKETVTEGQPVEKPKPDSTMPPGLYELLKEVVDKSGLGINYTLKIKNFLNDIDPPPAKKAKVVASDSGQRHGLPQLALTA